jgi:hypothetical protein
MQKPTMTLNGWRFVVLVLTALALTMTSAHLLELPQKMQYSPDLYTAVNTTLYRYFAIAGGTYQVSSIVAAGVLTFLLRRHVPAFHWTLFGAVCLGLAFVSWILLVAPVNSRIGQRCSTLLIGCLASGCSCGIGGVRPCYRVRDSTGRILCPGQVVAGGDYRLGDRAAHAVSVGSISPGDNGPLSVQSIARSR